VKSYQVEVETLVAETYRVEIEPDASVVVVM
jgi:hypothetical protein